MDHVEANACDMNSDVLKVMTKYSSLHLDISKAVDRTLGAKWVTYDWLSKTIGRIISQFESYDQLENAIATTVAIKQRMRERVQLIVLKKYFKYERYCP